MRRKRHHAIALVIASLMILALSLGTSFGRISACAPDCPECIFIVSCCAGMDSSETSGTGGSAKPLSGSNHCDHEGICVDNFQTISTSTLNNSFQYDSSPSLSPHGSSIKLKLYKRASIPILQEPSSETFPSLFIRNCSFLI